MVHILAQVNIAELPRFLGVFATQGADVRRRHGSQNAQIFTVPGEPGRIIVLFQWESRAAFEGFLADETTRGAMQESGTLGRPEFTVLENVANLPV